ncbi:MAG: hypothetical protein IJB90_02375 [Clostridia bacterium]|nr:hypothetical protein [Clostridia bacterium]
MEEKKEIKVRLSTVVYLFIILVLVGALGVVYYLGFVKDDNANNMIANGEVAEKNNISVNEQVPEVNNNVEEKEELKKDQKQEIINILKNTNNSKAYFNVLKINYENEKYNVEVEYSTPVVISENEFNNLKKDKEITLNNEKYEYVTDNDSANGYIQKNNQKYEVINYNNGYVFELTGTAGGYTWTINKTENMKFVADEDTLIYDSFTGQEYKLKDNKTKDWLNRSLENTIVRLNYSEDLGLSIFIDNK